MVYTKQAFFTGGTCKCLPICTLDNLCQKEPANEDQLRERHGQSEKDTFMTTSQYHNLELYYNDMLGSAFREMVRFWTEAVLGPGQWLGLVSGQWLGLGQ